MSIQDGHRTGTAAAEKPPPAVSQRVQDDPLSGEQDQAAMAQNPTVLANPAALGLAGFSLANLVLNLINSGFVGSAALLMVVPLALFCGGLMQVGAAWAEFRRGNTFGGTAFGSYGAFWLCLWMFFQFLEPRFASPAAAHHALAVFLLVWLVWTVLLWVATFRVSVVLNLLFLDLIGVFAFQSAGLGLDQPLLVQVGGYLGLVLSVIGFYGAFEVVVNETFGRSIVPNRLLTGEHSH